MGNVQNAKGRQSISSGARWPICLAAILTAAILPLTSTADTLQTTVQPTMGLNYMISTQGTDPAASANEPFAGEIAAFSSDITEPGWIPCDGSTLPIAGNSLLYSVIGTTYGGDGITNFDLPDLDGRVAIGAGQGLGLTNRNLGDTPGTLQVSLNTAILPVADGGQGQSFTNMQSSETVNYIINTAGIYPSRSVATPLLSGSPSVSTTYSTTSLLGTVVPFAGSVAPAGWAFCDGSLLAKNSNTALFSILGTDFGGDGVNTFALPDLRGRAPIDAGQGYGLSQQILGEMQGSESTTLNPNNVPMPPALAQPYSNLQPTLTLNYIIALNGTYPTITPGLAGADGLTPDIGGTADPELAQISLTAANFAPLGWAFCNGQLLPIQDYPALYSLIGATYGGNNVTTFALPNLQSRIIAGADGTDFTPAELTGVEYLTLTAQDVANLPEPSSMALLSSAIFLVRRRTVLR